MRSLLFTAAIVAISSATPAVIKQAHHEKREFHSSEWKARYRPHGGLVVPVRIAMTQPNLHIAETLLMEVSDTDSDFYGKHYTLQQVSDLFSPANETVNALVNWLESSGVHRSRIGRTENKQWLAFDINVKDLEHLVQTEYHVFDHEGTPHIGCEQYYLPEYVREHVDFILPGVSSIPIGELKSRVKRQLSSPYEANERSGFVPFRPFNESERQRILSGADNLDNCYSAASPRCIQSLYQFSPGNLSYPSEIGVFESYAQHYAKADLDQFYRDVFPRIPQGTYPSVKLINTNKGEVKQDDAGYEAMLDLDVIYPIVYPAPVTYYQVDDDSRMVFIQKPGIFNTFLYALDGSYCSEMSPLDPKYPNPAKGGYKGQQPCGKYKPTNVISFSYGVREHQLTVKYMRRQCNEILKLGLQGITFTKSTGDNGVSKIPRSRRFAVDSLANCPYILTIGSTAIPKGQPADQADEIATTQFGSGAGFSNVYTAPEYQKDAVDYYLTQNPPPYKSYRSVNNTYIGSDEGVWNRIGRGFPDVSALGQNVVVVTRGKPGLGGGTSSSSPIWASLIARINMERRKVGKGPVGFINPVLYKHPHVMNDVRVGSSFRDGGLKGFAAAPGWDPCTGLGTPNYPKLLKLFMSLP